MKPRMKITDWFIIGIFTMLMAAAFYTPDPAQAASQRNLSFGKIGGDVRQLQLALNKKGYRLDAADGIYGLQTRQAVIDLQKKNRLKVTGVFDSVTRKALLNDNRGASRMVRTAQNVSRGMSQVSRKDVITLARVVHGEARGEPFEGQVAVAAVILNRTRSGQFPNTIDGVVYQPGAFDAVSDGQVWLRPDEKSIKAAELALSGYDPTDNALFYWNPAKTTNAWIWSRPIKTQIGEHVFAK